MPDAPVQVLMPAYNAGRFVAEAIESVLAQTHANLELTVADDGSTDDTLAVARAFAARDARVRVTTHANAGIAHTLNRAMERINAEWLVCMHADDVMMPDRIARQLAFVRQHPEVAVASSLVVLIDERGREVGRSRSHLTSPAAVREAVAAGRCVAFHHPAVIMRPNVVKAVGGYRQDFWPAEDTELWNRVAAAGHLVLVQPEYLLKYRLHGSSASMSKSRLMVRKLRWMEQCMGRRRDGNPEPTWDEFDAARTRVPWPQRLNEHRLETARTLYQSALHHLSTRSVHKLVPAMLAATALEPGLVLPRLLPRVRGALLRGARVKRGAT